MVTDFVRVWLLRQGTSPSTQSGSLVITDQAVREISTIKVLPLILMDLVLSCDVGELAYTWGPPRGGSQTVRDIAKVLSQTL